MTAQEELGASRVAPGDGVRLGRTRLTHLPFVLPPVAVLVFFFLGPFLVVVMMSLRYSELYGVTTGFTVSNFVQLFSNPLYRNVAVTTVEMSGLAMVAQLALALPTGYVLAHRLGRWEIPGLLLLVMADELNPLVRIYVWRLILGRDGLINTLLTGLHVVNEPVPWLLYSKFAVVVVLTVGWLPYVTIPVYAAMKAIPKQVIEAAADLYAAKMELWLRIVLPLCAPGIAIAIILVFVPMFSEFATPVLVGSPSSMMLGNSVADLMLEAGDWGTGSALSLLMLCLAAGVSVLAYYLGRLNQSH